MSDTEQRLRDYWLTAQGEVNALRSQLATAKEALREIAEFSGQALNGGAASRKDCMARIDIIAAAALKKLEGEK